MKIVVIGGTGLIGSKVVTNLREQGHEAVPASPTVGHQHHHRRRTRRSPRRRLGGRRRVQLAVLRGRRVLAFFETSTRNLLAAEAAAGVGHHVALSIVGIDRSPDNGYFKAKIAQEKLIAAGPIPYSIVRATQFFEFVDGIADAATTGNEVHMAPVAFQPIAADDVASAVAGVAVNAPLNGRLEIAGPERLRFDERHPAPPAGAQRSASGGRRSARVVLRLGAERALARPAQRGAARHDPVRGLAQRSPRCRVATSRRTHCGSRGVTVVAIAAAAVAA